MATNNLLKKDMLDFIKVLEMGARKYEPNGWLLPDGAGTSEKEMHASMFRHLSKSAVYGELFLKDAQLDDESELDHLLHVACRALMLYTRRKRKITHSQDLARAYAHMEKEFHDR